MSSQLVCIENAVAPGAPPAGQVTIYARTDGNLYSKNPSNVETIITAGAAITAITGDLVATGPGSVIGTIQPNVVTNAKLSQAPQYTYKGNNTASTANEGDYQILILGAPSYSDIGIVAQITGNNSSYLQNLLQNINNNPGASSDFIVSNNFGTASTYYGDFGMNSSNFAGSGSLNLPNAVYLYSQNGDLVLGTTSVNAIHFSTNNAITDALQINSSNQIVTPALTGFLYGNGSGAVTAISSPLSVSVGGTGAASFTAYSVICGGTTSTGNYQSVASLGTAGNVLTSNGSGALPTWQASSSGFFYPNSTSTYGGTNGTLSFTGADEAVVGINAGAALTSGADNTFFGYNSGTAVTTGTQNVCVGSGAGKAIITSSANVCIGYNAGTTYTGTDGIIIGTNTSATTGTGNILIGYLVSATANNGQTLIGYSASGAGGTPTAIGYQSTSNSAGAAIGYLSNAGTNGVAIGSSAYCAAVTGGVAIGYSSSCKASGIAIGYEAVSSFAQSCVFSAGSTSAVDTASNQVCFGNATNALKDFYLGNGAAAVASPAAITMQPTPALGTNIAGSNHTVRGGASTGTGLGGNVIFQTTPAGSSGSSLNTQTLVGQVDSTGAWTLGATSTTPTHVLNTNTATTASGSGTFTNLPAGYSGNPTGYIQMTINGGTHIIPYW